MLINHAAAAAAVTTPAAKVCGNCGVDGHKILHNVRHRGIFRRLCTSCVLRLHPQSFCPTCFVVYQTPIIPNSVVTCVKCYSSSHSTCVGPAQQPRYYCPMCVGGGEPVFVLRKPCEGSLGIEEGGVVIDERGARVLVAAAMISSLSMNEAEVAARAVAERRAKDAAVTRKRAMQALDYMAMIASREKMKKIESLPGPVVGVGGISKFKGNVGSVVTERGGGYGHGYGRGGNLRSDVVSGVIIEEKKKVVGSVVDRSSNEVITSALNAGRAIDRSSNEVITSALNDGSAVDRSSNEVITNALNDGSVVNRSSNEGVTSAFNAGGVVDRSSNEVVTSALNSGSVVDRSSNEVVTSVLDDGSAVDSRSDEVLTSSLNDGSVVDRRSNVVFTSALNAVELRENGRLGGVGQQGNGVMEMSTSDCVAMDIDERKGISSGSGVVVGVSAVQDRDGEVLNELSDDPAKLNGEDAPREFVNNGVVLHPPKEDLMEGVVSGNPMKESVGSTDPGQNENGLQH
ncbi:hypothetical protein LIER_01527 [Lithospermum erythrorhizon]|uniref:Uncharacterized protein n=1 Tax=Lithospermum erythrorhizon TaxID=34254 RepID=A0AAV3NLA6_LITER